MSEPTYDDERDLRSALGTLLVDEPTPQWSVADDVERGRAYRNRRRARIGGGVALVAVIALVAGVVGPMRAGDRLVPAPLGSATPTPALTGAQLAVVTYLNDQGWPVSGAQLSVRPDDGALVAASYAVHGTQPPSSTAVLTVQSYDSAPARDLVVPVTSGSRFGSALQRCGDACGSVSVTTQSCVSGALSCYDSEVTSWVTKPTATLAVGELIVERTWADGTQLEAVVGTPQCSPCETRPSPRPSTPGGAVGSSSFLTTAQTDRVLDLTGKPTPRAQSTVAPPTVDADPVANPYYVVHEPDPLWLKASLAALSAYAVRQGASLPDRGLPGTVIGLQRGDVRAWLQLSYATTTDDAPECLGLPNCTVIQPWASARGGTSEVAVTETTIAPGTVSNAMRGPSYQLLVRSGHRLVRLDEGTTFPTLFNGQRPGYVLTWQQVRAAADLLALPAAPSPSPTSS